MAGRSSPARRSCCPIADSIGIQFSRPSAIRVAMCTRAAAPCTALAASPRQTVRSYRTWRAPRRTAGIAAVLLTLAAAPSISTPRRRLRSRFARSPKIQPCSHSGVAADIASLRAERSSVVPASTRSSPAVHSARIGRRCAVEVTAAQSFTRADPKAPSPTRHSPRAMQAMGVEHC